MGVLRTRTIRDLLLVLLGATAMRLASSFFQIFTQEQSIIVNTQISSRIIPQNDVHAPAAVVDRGRKQVQEQVKERTAQKSVVTEIADVSHNFPETTIVSHAPGWTVFRNLYMSNGTLFVVTNEPPMSFPDIQYITSTGRPAEATEESVRARMPTADNMDFITPAQARLRWGSNPDRWERNRVWSVEGNTFLFNDPHQFLDHYYHFCAELLFGAWAFWSGAFKAVVDPSSASLTTAPPVQHVIFAHADAYGWRDGPGFNSYFMRAVFPSITVEVEEDWEDRIDSTVSPGARARAWHFDNVLLADRSAAFRGEACGSRTQRTAAEAVEHMRRAGNLTRWWWEPVRRAVLRFAGVDERVMDIGVRAEQTAAALGKTRPQLLAGASAPPLHLGQDVVITYISRQGSKRHLIEGHHEALVTALTEMCRRHGWELNIVQAERLSMEQQLELAARTTIMLGVHGNGLTHLIMMPVTPISAVIEIFYPTGFAHDYQWTTHALGMRHFAVWNDTYHTVPDKPDPNYPEGFQGTQIPVYPPTITQIIEDRIAGRV
ncbi:hypothetical protein BKA93DRAFT_776889 [Sparassis latifolia]